MIHAKRNIKLRFGIAEAFFLNFITEKTPEREILGGRKICFYIIGLLTLQASFLEV